MHSKYCAFDILILFNFQITDTTSKLKIIINVVITPIKVDLGAKT